MAVVSMKQLLESGVHFGHATRRWDPRMAPFIFTSRNGIHIIDLKLTALKIEVAYQALNEIVAEGGKVLFVGTKKQAQQSVKDEALRTYYVNFINFANILTLVRCQSLKWPLDKFLEMYIGYGTIDKDDFIAAYALTGENLSKHFVKKEYGESIAKGLKAYDDDHNLSNLEKYLDELKLEIMKNYSLQFSSIGPLVYYYLEKQAEAKNIRLIYSDHEADTNDLLNY